MPNTVEPSGKIEGKCCFLGLATEVTGSLPEQFSSGRIGTEPKYNRLDHEWEMRKRDKAKFYLGVPGSGPEEGENFTVTASPTAHSILKHPLLFHKHVCNRD